jgi:hypothetical protein
VTDDGTGTMADYTQTNPNWGSIGKSAGQFTGGGLGANVATARYAGATAISVDKHYAKLKMTGLAFNGSNRRQGVIVGSSTGIDAARDHYAAFFEDDAASGGTHTWRVVKMVNDVETELASGSRVASNGDTISLEFDGSSGTSAVLRAYYNDSTQLGTTITDNTSPLVSGSLGPMLGQDQVADDLELGDIVADAPPPPPPSIATAAWLRA